MTTFAVPCDIVVAFADALNAKNADQLGQLFTEDASSSTSWACRDVMHRRRSFLGLRRTLAGQRHRIHAANDAAGFGDTGVRYRVTFAGLAMVARSQDSGRWPLVAPCGPDRRGEDYHRVTRMM
jgi:hypothetical protein